MIRLKTSQVFVPQCTIIFPTHVIMSCTDREKTRTQVENDFPVLMYYIDLDARLADF